MLAPFHGEHGPLHPYPWNPLPTPLHSSLAGQLPSGAAERANYQLFLSELCDLRGVARPDRVDDILETLASLGQARAQPASNYVAV